MGLEPMASLTLSSLVSEGSVFVQEGGAFP